MNEAVPDFEHFHCRRLVVVIPALNEEVTIRKVIQEIPSSIPNVGEVIVVVVDDGSNDTTAVEAVDAGAVVVKHAQNLGVGAAFATGLEKALRLGADLIVNMDADGQFNPADIEKLIQPIMTGDCGFVTCTRFGNSDYRPKMPWVKRWGNKMMCRIVNWVTDKKFTDVSCGFRAYTRETALRLNLYGRFTYTQESFIDLANKNVVMQEVPLVVRGVREFGKSRVASNLFKYAARTSMIIIRALRDTKPLMFFGTMAALFLFLGISCYGFIGVWWLITSKTSPWTSLLSVGTVLTIIGVGVGVLSLIADQIGRGRRVQEQLLYFQRKQYLEQFQRADGVASKINDGSVSERTDSMQQKSHV